MTTQPRWLQILDAEMGVAEVLGPGSNPRIMEYFAAAGASWVKDDVTPWCGAAVAFAAKSAGYPLPAEPLRARSWALWGTPCALVEGAIVVIDRPPNPAEGHVGTLVARRDGRIYLLSGNQGDTVSIASFDERRIVPGGVRWPPGAPPPVDPTAAPDQNTQSPGQAKPTAATSNKVGVTLQEKTNAAVAAFKSSKTVLGGLLALLGTFLQWLSDGVQFLFEGAAELIKLKPIEPLLLAFGANAKSIGFGLAVFGLATVFGRRLITDAKPVPPAEKGQPQ